MAPRGKDARPDGMVVLQMAHKSLIRLARIVRTEPVPQVTPVAFDGGLGFKSGL